MPRSKALDKVMRDGSWTNERVFHQLNDVSYTYLEQVMSGNQAPSMALGLAIRNIIAPSAKVRELFPSVKEVDASLIDGSAGSYNMPPSRTGNGSNRSASRSASKSFPAENLQSLDTGRI